MGIMGMAMVTATVIVTSSAQTATSWMCEFVYRTENEIKNIKHV